MEITKKLLDAVGYYLCRLCFRCMMLSVVVVSCSVSANNFLFCLSVSRDRIDFWSLSFRVRAGVLYLVFAICYLLFCIQEILDFVSFLRLTF